MAGLLASTQLTLFVLKQLRPSPWNSAAHIYFPPTPINNQNNPLETDPQANLIYTVPSSHATSQPDLDNLLQIPTSQPGLDSLSIETLFPSVLGLRQAGG